MVDYRGQVGRVGRARPQRQQRKVIPVDFQARRRRDEGADVWSASAFLPELVSTVASAHEFLVFWRALDGTRRREYLGGRWDRGWMLFVWTRDDLLSRGWHTLVEGRGYVPERLNRRAFRDLLGRCAEVVGLIINGDIDPDTRTIRAAPEQMVPRVETLRLLRG